MIYCDDMVPALKRLLAPPGQFDTMFPSATTEELSMCIADAFSWLQLFEMLTEWTLDPYVLSITPDLPLPEQQAVAVTAAIRMVRTQLRNTKNRVQYEAGPTRYQVEVAASMLTSELAMLSEIWDEIKGALGGTDSGATDVYVFDNYYERQASIPMYYSYSDDNYVYGTG
jgi:hypothetical protein